MSELKESSYDLQSEVPSFCLDHELGEIAKEYEQLKIQQAKQKLYYCCGEIIDRESSKKQQELAELNHQLLAEIARLQRENEELRRLNELYCNNSKCSDEEHSYLIREVASLRNELCDCEEAAAHFSSCINEIEKFLSSRYPFCYKQIKILTVNHLKDLLYLIHVVLL